LHQACLFAEQLLKLPKLENWLLLTNG
jgi:hypothetical protein